MTKIVSRFVYHIFYTIYYMLPIIILMLIGKTWNVSFTLRDYLDSLGIFKIVIVLPVVAYFFILPSYRAKIAANVYGDSDIGFWTAHSISGTILKSHMTFLPIIGKFFEKDKN